MALVSEDSTQNMDIGRAVVLCIHSETFMCATAVLPISGYTIEKLLKAKGAAENCFYYFVMIVVINIVVALVVAISK